MRVGHWGAATAVVLIACDDTPPPDYFREDGFEIGGAPGLTLACERYCNASFSVGCPPIFEGCADGCEKLFRGSCEQELADYLACVPAGLTQTCLVGLTPPCAAADEALYRCRFCGDGYAGVVGERGCESAYDCGLVARCDDDGLCQCWRGDSPMGVCQAVIAGIDACEPATSCCSAFL